jgi:hypothetical protein
VVNRFLRHNRAYSPVGARCDVCKGEGLLELAPLPDGRWACPVCRHSMHVTVAPLPPPFDRATVADDWPAPALVLPDPEADADEV